MPPLRELNRFDIADGKGEDDTDWLSGGGRTGKWPVPERKVRLKLW
jgi:hypothetical protein